MILEPTSLRFFLNLDHREDRRRRTEKQFEQLGLDIQRHAAIDGQKVRFNPTRWTHAGRRAVAIGFMQMIREAKRLKAPHVEIWEDDLGFHPNFLEEVSKINLPDDWDIFYFGGIHYTEPEEVDGIIVKARSMVMNHAMIFRDKAYSKAIKAIQKPLWGRFNCDKDLRLAELQKTLNVYAPKTNLVWQIPDTSDLAGCRVEHFHPDGRQKIKARQHK